MKQKIYLETSVISYLTARPSRDLIVAGHQQITQEWWTVHRFKFDLFVSQTTIEEALMGDTEAVQQRLKIIENMPLLEITQEAVALAKDLIQIGPLPEKAKVDALHIAIAVTSNIEYLLTWNCKHLANATFRNQIDHVCHLKKYNSIIICTPEELLED